MASRKMGFTAKEAAKLLGVEVSEVTSAIRSRSLTYKDDDLFYKSSGNYRTFPVMMEYHYRHPELLTKPRTHVYAARDSVRSQTAA